MGKTISFRISLRLLLQMGREKMAFSQKQSRNAPHGGFISPPALEWAKKHWDFLSWNTAELTLRYTSIEKASVKHIKLLHFVLWLSEEEGRLQSDPHTHDSVVFFRNNVFISTCEKIGYAELSLNWKGHLGCHFTMKKKSLANRQSSAPHSQQKILY